jgi:hypothetical protein
MNQTIIRLPRPTYWRGRLLFLLRIFLLIIIIGERPYLTTKIITLSEFFNFVHQVSRL